MAMSLIAKRSRMPRRLLAGAGAVVFLAVFFAMPLYAAVTLCKMPCCHHDSATSPAMSADMPACATDCFVRSDEATAAATKARFVAPENRSVVVISTASFAMIGDATAPLRTPMDAGPAHAGGSAPLNLLNSVFRI